MENEFVVGSRPRLLRGWPLGYPVFLHVKKQEEPQNLLQMPKVVKTLPAESGQPYCFAKLTGQSAVGLTTKEKWNDIFQL